MLKAQLPALSALSLDNQLAESHISLGIILNYYDYDFARAEREFQRAIELNPNSAPAHEKQVLQTILKKVRQLRLAVDKAQVMKVVLNTPLIRNIVLPAIKNHFQNMPSFKNIPRSHK